MWRYVYADELYHSGVKNMKWGQRRYQNEDGSLTPLGRIHYGYKKKKTEKKRKENLEKARAAKAEKKRLAEEEAKKQQEAAAERERIVRDGTPSEILKIKGDLTPAERSQIETRLKWEDQMRTYQNKEIEAGKAKTDKFFKDLDDANKKVETLAKTWNTAANIINAFNGDKVMPKIDTDITKGNKDQVAKRHKDKQKAKEATEKRAKQEAEGDAIRAERANKKADKDGTNQSTQQTQGGTKADKKAAKKAEKEAKKAAKKAEKEASKNEPKTERYEATGDDIIGEGTSRSDIKNEGRNNKEKPSDYYDPIDSVASEYYDDPVNNLPSTYIDSGEKKTRRYL